MKRQHSRLGRYLARTPFVLFLAWAVCGQARPVLAQGAAQQYARQVLAPAIEQIEDRHASVEAAAVAAMNGDPQQALQLLQQAKAADARLAPADAMFARMLIVMGNGDAAIQAIEAAAKASPDDPEPYLLSGQISLQLQQLTAAEACFLHGLALSDDYSENDYRKRSMQIMALSGLEAIAVNRQQWERALQFAQAWHDLAPSDVQATTRLARALFHEGGQEQREQAYRLLGEAYRADSTLSRPEISMAQLYAGIGEYRREFIDRAIERDPNTLATRLAACRWAMEAKDFEFAAQNAAVALNIDRDNVEALILAGAAARAQGNLDEAERVLLTAHRLSPAELNISNALALVLSEQDNAEKQAQAVQYAQANFERLSGGYPAQANARELAVTLAWCQHKAGNQQAALRILDNLLQQENAAVSGDAAYYTAAILYDLNNSRIAREVLVAALASEAPFQRRTDAESLLRKIPPP